MDKQRKWSLLLMGSVLVLLLALIGSIALAQDATPEATTPAQEDATEAPSLRGFGHWGGLGRSDGDSDWLSYLAEALGITVDELADAQQRAYGAALADAVAAGQLTQEQADDILARRALKRAIDKNAILAEALGLTVDELEAALAGDGRVHLRLLGQFTSLHVDRKRRNAVERLPDLRPRRLS